MNKKDQQLYDLVRWQEALPVVHLPRGQLAKPLRQMELTALVSRLAMNVTSDAHIYTVLKLITTVQQAELLKQTYPSMPPELEAAYRGLTKNYMDIMGAIPEWVAARLLEELKRLPDMYNGSFWSRLRDLLEG